MTHNVVFLAHKIADVRLRMLLHSHPSGNVCGVTWVQFLAVPENALISLQYEDDVTGQALVTVEKM